MSSKSFIKKTIQDLAADNFVNFPELYQLSSTGLTRQCLDNLDALAQSYYDNRTEEEIYRDLMHDVSIEEYEYWVYAHFMKINFIN